MWSPEETVKLPGLSRSVPNCSQVSQNLEEAERRVGTQTAAEWTQDRTDTTDKPKREGGKAVEGKVLPVG
jgi:hypothetical protein